MIIIGLTGGIGMGKSTVARLFTQYGVPVHSADEAVHHLLSKSGGAVKKIAKIFPKAYVNGGINRAILGTLVFGQPKLLKKLEAIIHPLVQRDERGFVARHKKAGAVAVVLEIPLLFETGAEKRCDFVVTVTVPRAIQEMRVLKRKGMTRQKFQAILKAQMKDSERKKRADIVIPTGNGLAVTRKWVKALVAMVEQNGGAT